MRAKILIKGILAENFVYLMLRGHIDEIAAGNATWFATYEKIKGELDFNVRSLTDHKNYGIEIKVGSKPENTVTRLLRDEKIHYSYYLKGDSYGGITESGDILTVPLYLTDRTAFDWERKIDKLRNRHKSFNPVRRAMTFITNKYQQFRFWIY